METGVFGSGRLVPWPPWPVLCPRPRPSGEDGGVSWLVAPSFPCVQPPRATRSCLPSVCESVSCPPLSGFPHFPDSESARRRTQALTPHEPGRRHGFPSVARHGVGPAGPRSWTGLRPEPDKGLFTFCLVLMLSAVFASGLDPGWQRGLSSESRHFVNIVWLPAMIRLHSGKPDVLLDSLIQHLPYQRLLIWGRLA